MARMSESLPGAVGGDYRAVGKPVGYLLRRPAERRGACPPGPISAGSRAQPGSAGWGRREESRWGQNVRRLLGFSQRAWRVSRNSPKGVFANEQAGTCVPSPDQNGSLDTPSLQELIVAPDSQLTPARPPPFAFRSGLPRWPQDSAAGKRPRCGERDVRCLLGCGFARSLGGTPKPLRRKCPLPPFLPDPVTPSTGRICWG